MIFAHAILGAWLGVSFADQYWKVLIVMGLSFALLSINVAPHYILLGSGQPKFVSVLNVGGGIAMLFAMAILGPAYGLLGVALSRGFYGLVVSMSYWKLLRWR